MMKSNLKQLALVLLAVVIVAPTVARAQSPGVGANMMNSALLKLFGPHTNFSCKAEIHVLDAIQKETDVIPLGLSVSGGNMRCDIDFAQIKGSDIPPAMMTTLKQLGMDQAVIINRPGEKIILTIYPKVRAFAEAPMSKDEIAASEKIYSIKKEKAGRETLEGHSCEKNKVILTDEKGVKHDATVWNATDLKDFPIQIQMTETETAVKRDSTLIMKFRDIKLGKAEPSRFEAPAGITKYKNVDALMDAAAKGNLGAPK
jgi:hypothetical protein